MRILDPGERPIAGARVLVLDGGATLARSTDEHGRCRFFVRDSPTLVRIRAEAAGRVHSSYAWDRHEPVELELWPAARVRGRVLAEGERAPVAGARIRLEHANCEGCGPDEVVSAPDGCFELSEVPCLDTVSLAVVAEGFVPIERLDFRLSRVEVEVEQDLHLVRGQEVRGLVRDWTTLAGIPRASVSGLVADAEGRFHGRIAADPGTTRTHVSVSAEGHAMLRAPVDLAQGELEFRLPRLVKLEGEVSDPHGAPLAGASVFVRIHGPARRGWSARRELTALRTPSGPRLPMPRRLCEDGRAWPVPALRPALELERGGRGDLSRIRRRYAAPPPAGRAGLDPEHVLRARTLAFGRDVARGPRALERHSHGGARGRELAGSDPRRRGALRGAVRARRRFRRADPALPARSGARDPRRGRGRVSTSSAASTSTDAGPSSRGSRRVATSSWPGPRTSPSIRRSSWWRARPARPLRWRWTR